jgi:hypothetical protein
MKGIAVYPGKMNSSHIVEIDTPNYDFDEKWPTLLERIITRKEPFENFKEAMKRDPGDIKTILEINR